MRKSLRVRTCNGNAEESWKCSDGQYKTPSSGKLSGTDPVECVLVNGVLVASQTESVEPGEEDVSMVSVDGGQSQQRETCRRE